jgi:hypothetical protein
MRHLIAGNWKMHGTEGKLAEIAAIAAAAEATPSHAQRWPLAVVSRSAAGIVAPRWRALSLVTSAPACLSTRVDFGFNPTPRDIQQGFSDSFETLLSISVSIETEMMIAFDEGRGVRRSNNSMTFGGMAGRTI